MVIGEEFFADDDDEEGTTEVETTDDQRSPESDRWSRARASADPKTFRKTVFAFARSDRRSVSSLCHALLAGDAVFYETGVYSSYEAWVICPQAIRLNRYWVASAPSALSHRDVVPAYWRHEIEIEGWDAAATVRDSWPFGVRSGVNRTDQWSTDLRRIRPIRLAPPVEDETNAATEGGDA